MNIFYFKPLHFSCDSESLSNFYTMLFLTCLLCPLVFIKLFAQYSQTNLWGIHRTAGPKLPTVGLYLLTPRIFLLVLGQSYKIPIEYIVVCGTCLNYEKTFTGMNAFINCARILLCILPVHFTNHQIFFNLRERTHTGFVFQSLTDEVYSKYKPSP